jgi:Fe-S-cluster-containing hydrogenase component 2
MRIVAESDCSLLQIALADLRNAQRSLPMLMAALRRTYRWRVIDSALARVPLFRGLAPTERAMLAARLRPLHYERDGRIVKQGGSVDTLYLIGNGQVRVAHGELELLLLGEGDFFGEIALLSDRPYPVEVRATTSTDLLALPRTEFEQLLGQHPNLATHLQAPIEQRRQTVTTIGTDHEHPGVLEPAVRAGMLRGTHLLVRNPELCEPDCHRCEQGCAERHGRARLQLDGQLINGLEVADSCRQCTLDAECATVCPADAFERAENGALLVTDRCIGCGKCIPACPYDAVASVGLPSVRPAPGELFTLLRTTFERIRRHQIIPLDPIVPHQRADKCDLCHGFADLACVSHCPSGALRLVSVEELFPR